MGNSNFSPKFVKARVVFNLDEQQYDFGEHLINSSGVEAAPWDKFSPTTHIGKKITAHVKVLNTKPFKFVCPGSLTCETTERNAFLGIQLLLPDTHLSALNQAIEKEGILPEYARKFPRIPYTERIGLMPQSAIVKYKLSEEPVLSTFKLDNLSPTGLQVSTEDSRADVLIPGEIVQLVLMPRGSNVIPVSLNVVIKRVIKSVDPISGNSRTQLGMNIQSITEDQRTLFTGLLRSIVEKLSS